MDISFFDSPLYSPEKPRTSLSERVSLRVYTDGVFDMFHIGHANLFKQIKNDLFDQPVYLIVGISGAEEVTKLKGNTVSTEEERYTMVEQCKYVDEIIKECPWKIDKDFIYKWDIDYVVHDDIPYTYGSREGEDIYKYVKDKNMFVASKRTPGVSTSDIITRILKDYNMYIVRNLKRGVGPNRLNISTLKAQYILFEDHIKYKKKKVENIFFQLSVKTNKEFVSSIEDLWKLFDDMIDTAESRRLNMIKDFEEKRKLIKESHPLFFKKKTWMLLGTSALIVSLPHLNSIFSKLRTTT